MPFLETRQEPLFYAECGKKTPALWCVHGAGGSHQHWGLQCLALKDIANIVTPDLPGHGRSPGVGYQHISEYSQLLLAAMDKKNHERVVLAGHSMGGAIALWTAIHAPERVRGLVLISSGARLPVLPDLFAYLDQDRFPDAVEAIVTRAYSPTASANLQTAGKTAFLQNNPQVLHHDLLACQAYNVLSRLSEVVCPTLIICGDTDHITPLKFSQTLHDGIRGSSLFIVPESGHMALIEQPDAVNMALRQFLHLVAHHP